MSPGFSFTGFPTAAGRSKPAASAVIRAGNGRPPAPEASRLIFTVIGRGRASPRSKSDTGRDAARGNVPRTRLLSENGRPEEHRTSSSLERVLDVLHSDPKNRAGNLVELRLFALEVHRAVHVTQRRTLLQLARGAGTFHLIKLPHLRLPRRRRAVVVAVHDVAAIGLVLHL